MDDLFRFISVRPAQSVDTSRTVSISGNTPFQEEARSNFNSQIPPDERWRIVRRVAEQFIHYPQLVTDITSLAMYPQYHAFRSRLETPDPSRNLASVGTDIQNIFGNSASGVVADTLFQEDRARVWDSIILIFLLSQLQRGPFAELVKVAQIMDIIRRVAEGDTSLDSATAVDDALTASVVLPPDLFPSIPGRIMPVGIADLLVVKQHILRYEPGEIVQIENILRGESRKKTNKHLLSNERTVVVETTTTTEKTNDLQTSERFALKREAENTVKEDTSVKAGVSATYKYGDTLQINANVNVDYSNAKTDSQKVSSDYAKDVVARATSKVTEQIRQQETTRILETFEEDEDHSFDNTQGTKNISGIYQWVNKVYKAQVFNYGKRLLFDIMVPEPAALLLEATTIQSQTQLPPGPPKDFKVKPADLSHDHNDQYYYGRYLAEYDVEGVSSPPLDNITVAKTFALSGDDKATDKGAEVPILDGYRAIKVHVGGEYNYTDNNNGLSLWVGDKNFSWAKQVMTTSAEADLGIKAAKAIPIAIETFGVSDYAVLVEIDCEPLDSTWEQWRLDTHAKILAAWQKKLRDYQDALAALKFAQPTQGPLGSNNPDDNRRIERTELKRAAIALLSENNLLGFNAIDQDPLPPQPIPPNSPPPQRFPRPNQQASQTVGNYARFFEQAFEWEQMSYIFYPYYWARKEVWYDKVLRTNDDPLFAEFLRAGQARVVIPVRPSLEPALWYFLMTGQIWEGGDPPMVTDADYLPIAEEIKEATGAPGDELPYGPAWEVFVPTTLIKLRDDDQLSNVTWTLTPPWTWTANQSS